MQAPPINGTMVDMIIAIDTGGTKTLIAKFSDDGELVSSRKFPTPRDQAEYLSQVISVTRELSGEDNPRGISIALPGVIRDQKAVICKNLGWQNFDVISELKTAWPDIPMWLENDANLGGVGAANLISPTPEKCLYVTVSTGIGGGYIENKRIVSSTSESEISDIHFEYNGVITRWGAIANGRAIMSDFGVYASQLTNPDDQREIGRRVARGLMALMPVLRPDVIAFGGGVGAHYHLFERFVLEELEILPEQYRCPIVTAPRPEEIVIYGCYYHAIDQLNN